MSSLNSYSIESDDAVLLKFSDGRSQRASVKELPKLLSKNDLKKIQSALKLRAHYIEKHLPHWLKIAVLLALLVPLGAETSRAAQVVRTYIKQHTHHSSGPQQSPSALTPAATTPKTPLSNHQSSSGAPTPVVSEEIPKQQPKKSNGIGPAVSTVVKNSTRANNQSIGQKIKAVIQELKQGAPRQANLEH